MKDCNLNDREFKIAVWGNSMRYKINSERLFNELRKKINEQKKYFAEDTETTKKKKRNKFWS